LTKNPAPRTLSNQAPIQKTRNRRSLPYSALSPSPLRQTPHLAEHLKKECTKQIRLIQTKKLIDTNDYNYNDTHVSNYGRSKPVIFCGTPDATHLHSDSLAYCVLHYHCRPSDPGTLDVPRQLLRGAVSPSTKPVTSALFHKSRGK